MILLNETEARVLHVLTQENKGTWTPDRLAREMGMSRQRIVPVVNFLEIHELVIAKRLHKMTTYDITQPGRNALRACGAP